MAVALAVFPRQLLGQGRRKLQIIVVDSVTGAPIDHADVRVEPIGGNSGTPASVTTTDTSGRASLSVGSGERLLISVRRIGFVAATIPVTAGADDDVFLVALASSAVVLAPTVTRAAPTSRRLEVAGFYQRQHDLPGTFLDSAEIAKRRPYDLLSLLAPYLHDCTMVFVDGMELENWRSVHLQDVVAVEIYHSNQQAPPRFANPMESLNRCGSIVVWRRY